MPSRNIVKTFVSEGYYHVYNRGIDKKNIFLDNQDCDVFLYYLSIYLIPKEELIAQSLLKKRLLRFISKNLSQELDLLSYALMPNHFHLLFKQHTQDGITKLMKQVITAYVMYFNRKYERRGPLFESVYKACKVDQDSYLLHLSRYIHRNPLNIRGDVNFNTYSSYPNYLGMRDNSWVRNQELLQYFNTTKKDLHMFTYKSFVEEYAQNPEDILGSLILE